MELNKKDLKIVYSLLLVCIDSVDMKKHKEKNDIIALHQMRDLCERIENNLKKESKK